MITTAVESQMSRSRIKQPPDVKPFRVRWSDVFGEHEEFFSSFQSAYSRFKRLERAEDNFLIPDAGSLALDVLDGVEWLRYK